MKKMHQWLLVAALAVLAAAWATPAPAADAPAKINLLIIDGQNNHKWAETPPPIKEMLEKTGRFTVDVLTSPPALAKNADDAAKQAGKDAWAKFKPDFTKYQVVLSNYYGQPWPEDFRRPSRSS